MSKLNDALKDLLNSTSILNEETIGLKKIHATSNCRYSEIETRLQILQENQEIILKEIKGKECKSELLSKEEFILSLIYYFAESNDLESIKMIKEKGIPHTLIIGGNKTTCEKHPYTNIQVVTYMEFGEIKAIWN